MTTIDEQEKRTVLPLVGSHFASGTMEKYIAQIQDMELAEIAQAEVYYFTAKRKSIQ